VPHELKLIIYDVLHCVGAKNNFVCNSNSKVAKYTSIGSLRSVSYSVSRHFHSPTPLLVSGPLSYSVIIQYIYSVWRLSAPAGSEMVGHPNATGWMTNENFCDFMKHFIKHAKPSVDQPVLLILDNHQSHINLDVIKYAKENHVTLLSFPPHCSHKLQPLDVSVYGPFKTYINQASDTWMRDPANAGKSMSIHVIPSLVSQKFPKAFSTTNITAGFKATGIWPFDKSIFPPESFISASTTDRPLPDSRPSPNCAVVGLQLQPISNQIQTPVNDPVSLNDTD